MLNRNYQRVTRFGKIQECIQQHAIWTYRGKSKRTDTTTRCTKIIKIFVLNNRETEKRSYIIKMLSFYKTGFKMQRTMSQPTLKESNGVYTPAIRSCFDWRIDGVLEM